MCASEQPRHFETVIIGTGFSGLLAAIRLQKNRCNDFVLLERSSELGGTWQANSYPGAEVDVPSCRPARNTPSPDPSLRQMSVMTMSHSRACAFIH